MPREYIRAVPIDRWPATHRSLYERARRATDYTDPGSGEASTWSDRSDQGVRQRWGLWLEYCGRQGVYFVEVLPADTITLTLLKGYVAELLAELSSVTAATYVRDMAEAICVMQPELFPRDEWTGKRLRTRAIQESVKLLAQAYSELNAAAEPEIDDISLRVGSSDLYKAGFARMARHEPKALQDISDALAFGDGLLMAVWSLTNVRLRTMALTNREHADQDGDALAFHYAAHEIKTRVDDVKPYSAELMAKIKFWFEVVDAVFPPAPVLDISGARGTPFWVVKRHPELPPLRHEELPPLRFMIAFEDCLRR